MMFNKQKNNGIISLLQKSGLIFFFILLLTGLIFIIFFNRNSTPEKINPDTNTQEKQNNFDIALPLNYQEPLVISALGNLLAIQPVNANNVTQEQLDPNTIKYRDAYPSTDVEQIKYPNKLKESLILKGPEHPKKFEYQIDIENFNWELNGDGDIIISSKKEVVSAIASSDGSELSAERMKQYSKERGKIFKIPKPFMFEQGKDERGEVKTEIIADRLVLTPDPEWLTKHHYPVIVDPTVEKMPQMVKELAEKRSYNSLTFLNDDGSFTTMAHGGNINYYDRVSSDFKPVDTTLEDKGDSWQQNKASYASSLPKFADEWLKFFDLHEGKNQLIEMRAIAQHVAGQLVTEPNEQWHNKKIIYPDAFGTGYDLELTNNNTYLAKVVKIMEKPNDLSRNLEFEFELRLPQNIKTKTVDGYWNDQVPKKTSKQIQLSGNNNQITYLRDFIAWDSLGSIINIEVELTKKGDKTILKKIIPKEFLADAKYPVYTDTVITYYTGPGDGGMTNRTTSDWSGCRSGSASYYAANYTGTSQTTYTEWDSAQSRYYIARAFWPFDTSVLPDNAVIRSATFYGYSYFTENHENDGNDFIVVLQGTQASVTTLDAEDFDQCGSTKGSATVDITSMSAAYQSFALNSTGLSWISLTDYTKLCTREGHDVENDTPTNSDNEAVFYTSEQTGTSQDPYLSITFTATSTVASVLDTPDPTNPGRSVSFIVDWDDPYDYIKVKVCKTNALTNQNCDGGYWASSTSYTNTDPAVVSYSVVSGDAGQTRDYTVFLCDLDAICTTGTSGTFSVNTISTVPDVKFR